MKRNKWVILMLVLVALTASGCLSDSDFPTLTCTLCGTGGLAETEYNDAHGVDKCVTAAPCGQTDHYVLINTTKDKQGVDHSKCQLCGGWLCTNHDGGSCVNTSTLTPPPTPLLSADATLKEMSLGEGGETASPDTIALSVQDFSQTVTETFITGDEVIITAVANHEKATVTGLGSYTLAEGANTLTVIVTAEDGTTQNTYTVTVTATAPLSDDCSLGSFYLTLTDGPTISLMNREARKNISVADTETATVTAVASDENATVTGDKGRITINEGENTYAVTVTAESGKTAKYVFVINMTPSVILSDDATLASLALEIPDSGTYGLDPDFSPDEYEYAAEGSEGLINVTCTANHEGATISGDGSYTLESGENVITITVTAEDGETELTYTITVYV